MMILIIICKTDNYGCLLLINVYCSHSVCLLLARKKSFTCSGFYVNAFIQKEKLRTKKKTNPISLKLLTPDQLPVVAELVQNLI